MRRNLICHIYPHVCGKWRRTPDHLLHRWGLFNGRKVVGVVIDDCTDSVAEVKRAFGDKALEIEWLDFANDHTLREGMTLSPMLAKVESHSPDEATFVCHSKGATRDGDGCLSHPWADVMFHVCLDAPELVECALRAQPICGAFKMYGSEGRDWIFAGSFYWIRHDETFRRNWREVPQIWTALENWPCAVFKREESQCLFMDNSNTPYDAHCWETVIIPAFLFWRENLRRAGVSMTGPLVCDWLRTRLDHFQAQIGQGGYGTIRLEKRSWPRIPIFRRLASLFSTA